MVRRTNRGCHQKSQNTALDALLLLTPFFSVSVSIDAKSNLLGGTTAMLDRDQFLHWCQTAGLSEQARKVIDQIRSSDPARRVQSGCRSVSGAYPSRKMGVTIDRNQY